MSVITKIRVNGVDYPLNPEGEAGFHEGDNITITAGGTGHEHDKTITANIGSAVGSGDITVDENGVVSLKSWNLVEGDNVRITTSGNGNYTISSLDNSGIDFIHVNELPTTNIKSYPSLYAVPDEIEEDVYLLFEYRDGIWIQYGDTDNSETGFPLDTVTGVVVTPGDEQVSLKWTDPGNRVTGDNITLATWKRTVVVRQIGRPPVGPKDGTVVVVETAENQYKNTAFVDAGLQNDVTYYYGIFPCSTNVVYNLEKTVSATPGMIFPSAPSNVAVTMNKASMSATVTWTKPSDATKCVVYMGTSDSLTDNSYTSKSGNLAGSSGSFTFNNLSLDTTYYFKVYAYNAKERATGSEMVNGEIKSLEIVSWADGDWDKIVLMLEAHYRGDIDIADYWSVGAERIIRLNATAADSNNNAAYVQQDMKMVIIGIGHDDLYTSISGKAKAAVTIQMKNCLSNDLSSNSSQNTYYWGKQYYPVQDSDYWSSNPYRTWANGVFITSMLPSGIRSSVKYVKKKCLTSHTGTGTTTTKDKAFWVSYPEVFGTTPYSYYIAGAAVSNYEGTQYSYYATASNRIKYHNRTGGENGGVAYWWLRSPSSFRDASYDYVWGLVTSGGAASQSYGGGTFGSSLAFCL